MKVVINLVNINRGDLHRLFLDFIDVPFKTDSGELIYLHGVRQHTAISDIGWYKHTFKTILRRKQDEGILAQVEIESIDNNRYFGKITYQEDDR